MPPYPKPASQAQRAAMHAAAAGKSTIGISKKVGAEFSRGDTGGKLPQRVATPHTVKGRPSMGGKGNKR